MSNESRYREALAQIAELAKAALAEVGDGGAGLSDHDYSLGCTIKALPKRLHERAAQTATRINPANAPLLQPPGVAFALPTPDALTVSTARYWGPAARQLSVSFMESTPADLRARIVSHLNAWSTATSLCFAETAGVGEVRISRGPGGYYSYLGTDVSLIPQDRQTMNLEAFTMDTPESEFIRVVRHEAGHTLGFVHEHMRRELVDRIDPEKAYPYFLATQGWDRAMVDAQVLTPLDEASIFGTAADEDSVMCYQLDGSITYDGQPIRGGADINATDYSFAGLIYPKVGFTAPARRVIADAWSDADNELSFA